jgi:hypothetical protein
MITVPFNKPEGEDLHGEDTSVSSDFEHKVHKATLQKYEVLNSTKQDHPLLDQLSSTQEINKYDRTFIKVNVGPCQVGNDFLCRPRNESRLSLLPFIKDPTAPFFRRHTCISTHSFT